MPTSRATRCATALALLAQGANLAGADPEACSRNFTLPSTQPTTPSTYNGVQLQDVCIPDEKKQHHVFVVGDWGGIVYFEHMDPRPADKRSILFPLFRRRFVKGVDDSAQVRVAKAMIMAAKLVDPDYILNVGDNFYWGGVKGDCGGPPISNDMSIQWNNTFEWVYNETLTGIPWLGVLGNHDYGGYKFTSKWGENIGYSWGGTPGNTNRWFTPALYWAQRVKYHDLSVHYLFLDTNAVEAWLPFQNQDHNICSHIHNIKLGTCGTQGPSSLSICHNWFWALWYSQFAWMEKQLEAAQASTYQVIVTHFPPKWFKSAWHCLSAKYGIDMHISGHIHHQSVYAGDNPYNFIQGGTCSIVSGGGGGITSEGIPSRSGRDDQYGFVDLLITPEHISVHAISHGGIVRRHILCPPRQATGVGTCSGAFGRRLGEEGGLDNLDNTTFI